MDEYKKETHHLILLTPCAHVFFPTQNTLQTNSFRNFFLHPLLLFHSFPYIKSRRLFFSVIENGVCMETSFGKYLPPPSPFNLNHFSIPTNPIPPHNVQQITHLRDNIVPKEFCSMFIFIQTIHCHLRCFCLFCLFQVKDKMYHNN